MKTEFENLIFISESFKEALTKLMENGLKLIIPEPTGTFTKTNYAHFYDGYHIGYLQQESSFREISISTVHKPSKEAGTGFRMSEEFSLKEAQKALLTVCPEWAINNRNHIIKYKNLKDFMESKTNNWHQLNIYEKQQNETITS
jgi:hypothetical protein